MPAALLALACLTMSKSPVVADWRKDVRQIAQSAGLPTTMAEWYRPSSEPASSNAASYLTALRNYHVDHQDEQEAYSEVMRPLTDVPKAREIVTKMAPYFEMAQQVSECKVYAPSVEQVSETERPATTHMATPGLYLCDRARLRNVEGDFSAAVEDLRRALRIANLVAQAPEFDGPQCAADLVRRVYRAAADLTVEEPAKQDAVRLALDIAKPIDIEQAMRGDATVISVGFGSPVAAISESKLNADGRKALKLMSDFLPKLMRSWVALLKSLHQNPTDPNLAEAAVEEQVAALLAKDPNGTVYGFCTMKERLSIVKTVRYVIAERQMLDLGLEAMRSNGLPNVSRISDSSGRHPFVVVATETGWKISWVEEPPEASGHSEEAHVLELKAGKLAFVQGP
ncbi:MAG: hypothetical protein ABUL72_04205 [Armatimonadota bacterium]